MALFEHSNIWGASFGDDPQKVSCSTTKKSAINFKSTLVLTLKMYRVLK